MKPAVPQPATIRPMRSTDYAAVLSLWQATEGLTLREADSEEAFGRYLARNPGLSFVVEGEAGLAGAVLCGHDGRRGYLHHLAVAPDRRRQGLGRALVERCLEVLRTQGILKCHLFVRTENTAALSFWRQLGWFGRPDVVMLSFSSGGEDA
jgi:ribosomal protein S18 acetylase RimI-like enzyme